LAIDRNHPHAHALIGVGKTFTGRYEETEAHVLEALRISPRDRRAGMWWMIAAGAKLLAGHDEEAVARLNRSIELDQNEPMRHFYLAAALAHLGRMEEAREAARVGLELNPGFTIARDRAARPSDHPVFLASLERLHEGMRLAGVPEE
jgi:tetratricopeptide (TPR) repeat protein